MGILKEFIKENSPQSQKKKKKRVRLKNFNPFRKRKYQTLVEDHNEPDGESEENPPLAEPRENSNIQSSDHNAQKPRRPKEIPDAACESLGLSKGGRGEPSSDTRETKSRRHGGPTACLMEEVLTTADPELSRSGQNVKEHQNSWSVVKPVTSDEIEVIETATEEVPRTKRKKRSTKKRVKKAGIKTVKMLRNGLANVAVSLQFVSPDAALSSVVKDMVRVREERYRDMMYAAAI